MRQRITISFLSFFFVILENSAKFALSHRLLCAINNGLTKNIHIQETDSISAFRELKLAQGAGLPTENETSNSINQTRIVRRFHSLLLDN